MENVDSIIIEHLRAIRADIASIKDDIREVKTRIAHVEAGIASFETRCGPPVRRICRRERAV